MMSVIVMQQLDSKSENNTFDNDDDCDGELKIDIVTGADVLTARSLMMN